MSQRLTFWSGIALTALLATGAAACGSDGGSSGEPSDPVARGKELAIANGCAACHGSDGQGGVGPTFVGLAGSTVELADGTTVVADTEYIRRSIIDPSADIRPGFNVNMPERSFEPGEVDLIVAWIESL